MRYRRSALTTRLEMCHPSLAEVTPRSFFAIRVTILTSWITFHHSGVTHLNLLHLEVFQQENYYYTKTILPSGMTTRLEICHPTLAKAILRSFFRQEKSILLSGVTPSECGDNSTRNVPTLTIRSHP